MPGVTVAPAGVGETLVDRVARLTGGFDLACFKQLLGAANAFKEGDAIVGVAAADDDSRRHARALLANTPIAQLEEHPLITDSLTNLLETDRDAEAHRHVSAMTVGAFREFLIERGEAEIQAVCPGLSSTLIGCVVKLMSDAELTRVGAKLFNPLPGSHVGAKGYLGARIQPNSPTDNVDDIRWQVLDGWSYAVGDIVLGNNPVSSRPESVAAIEATLKDLLVTFGLESTLPHCVLAHIDVQAEVERLKPGTTALWFQSIAGSDAANRTFGIDTQRMLDYAAARTGPFGLYFETGQGADFTNGHAQGLDMVLHEARKYGFARALAHRVEKVRGTRAWVHLNDVAGFIGPEVFRTREQLVRCCLEDIVMGKLHGLCIGLDVCSTLHMDVSLDDLDWCLERIAPACPAYLMALPTKIDPMLGYLTTGYHDHVRLRAKFGKKVDDRMWAFFQQLGVIDAQGQPTEHFGDPAWVYRQYRRRKGDTRDDADIASEARAQIAAVRARGVFLSEGSGAQSWQLPPHLDQAIRSIYADAKRCIWEELSPEFIAGVPGVVPLATRSADRTDYILHPESGERLSTSSLQAVDRLRRQHRAEHDVQLIVSDGLNALAISDEGHLRPFLNALRGDLARAGFHPANEVLVVTSGRVRAGYRIGECLFGGLGGNRSIVHIIGERPGSGHHTFSTYITLAPGSVWGQPGKVDHDITKVVSGIATTALAPAEAADVVVRLLADLAAKA